MDLGTWLDLEKGRATLLARRFSVSRSAISQWRTNGVPIVVMVDVRDYTNGDVSIEDMVAAAARSKRCSEARDAA